MRSEKDTSNLNDLWRGIQLGAKVVTYEARANTLTPWLLFWFIECFQGLNRERRYKALRRRRAT